MIALLATLALAGDVSSDGEIRLLGISATDIPVDARGTSTGQGFHLDSRVRAGLTAGWEAIRFTTEWDVLSGQLAGDTWDIPGTLDERQRYRHQALTLDGFQPRKLSVGFDVGASDVEIGLQTSHWGLGLLANDGDHEPLFGREDFGDRVIRAKLTTAPFSSNAPRPLFLVVAADLVYADEIARLPDGEVALQGTLALLYTEGEGGAQRGVYSVFRHQWEEGFERTTTVTVLDGFVSQPVALSDAFALRVEGEAVGVVGRTDRAVSYNAPTGLDVSAGAVAGRAILEHDRFDAHLRFGWQSGDGDADDKASHVFPTDRNFDVGMVLFDEVQGAIQAGTVALLEDPTYSAQAPDGLEVAATEGVWQAATYVQPAVEVRPIDQVAIRAGAVLAWSTAPIAQPFYSYRAGGQPHNHLDQPTAGRRLGTEIDWALAIKPVDDDTFQEWTLRPRLEVMGGHALLSDDMGGGTVSVIQAGLRTEW